jgi:hypothetical protein
MFYEYALEPAVLSSFERARYFLDAFGPWKGRFLAEYPRKWRKLVFENLHCEPREKLKVVERLNGLDKRVFSPRRDAPYDGTKGWLDNAQAEHARRAFHAIIAMESHGKEFILDATHMDENDPRWKVDQGRLVSRDPALFAQALELLLKASSRIAMIDPYFRADQGDKTLPLTAFCNVLRGQNVALEIHASENDLAYAATIKHAERALPDAVPDGMKVTLMCWREKAGGARLHNRYLLTDIAGVQFGDSIERGEAGHQDRVSILEERSRLELWEQYLGTPPAFDEAGPAREFAGRRGR